MRINIAVFCSSSRNIDEKYNAVAREFVRAASLHNCAIVSGATTKGTMGVLCDETSRLGVYHIGIVPYFMKDVANSNVDELHFVDTMAQRKDMMRDCADVAVALPGGIGTLDELFETWSLQKLGKYPGEVILFNYEGYYDGIVDFMTNALREKMMDKDTFDRLHVVTSVEECFRTIAKIQLD